MVEGRESQSKSSRWKLIKVNECWVCWLNSQATLNFDIYAPKWGGNSRHLLFWTRHSRVHGHFVKSGWSKSHVALLWRVQVCWFITKISWSSLLHSFRATVQIAWSLLYARRAKILNHYQQSWSRMFLVVISFPSNLEVMSVVYLHRGTCQIFQKLFEDTNYSSRFTLNTRIETALAK